MALSVGNAILASDFIALKERVKAECNRRRYAGSVAEYAGVLYDYDVPPVAGGTIDVEYYNKIVTPMNAILDTGYTVLEKGDAIPELSTLSNTLSTLEAEPAAGDVSSCRASCTGLCKGSCESGCTSCSDGCASTCTSGCKGGCSGCSSCSGTCSGCTSCVGGCSSTCQSTCRNGCVGTCTAVCRDTCAHGMS